MWDLSTGHGRPMALLGRKSTTGLHSEAKKLKHGAYVKRRIADSTTATVSGCCRIQLLKKIEDSIYALGHAIRPRASFFRSKVTRNQSQALQRHIRD